MKFEVGKIYQNSLYGENKYKCLGVFDNYPVMQYVSDSIYNIPFVVPILTSYEWKEYVEPKRPIIVERWVNYYLRPDKTVSAQLFTSKFIAERDFSERAASYERNPISCVKPLKTVYTMEIFDAV